ncbi:Ubiquitin-conjugating enzyme family protein [Trichomonas vaginalis G3]|uniref:Ubiquitin-conjugating enzyme family protein n=1 Tax=Trichomonas vaginalis (strain ATCC PRA-98 / G3) TaxID=412133 RepID=A2F612_TRIV3|nr:ubiquitin protein ligase binding [Trichomonas vaginalis G3]EAX99641.1 Ubiquitin-conjugating enzyme family protein [Trichomonas vaginalis G3]KAI5522434.1 ubiquitin protein ligase binding [Trichomonas vaginalis G3]|eukprot:XP_001312571.1 Ubiquitin-conjugating enzyme family protein [Trichomonas vaginalis G3]
MTGAKRLMSELKKIQKDNDGLFVAGPISDDDIFLWHFTVKGPKDTPFEGGIYHGTLTFPLNYPLAPPDITFLTPNGRFATDTRLCLSFTSYHPEQWNPGWDIRTALTALIAFFPTNPEGAIGGIYTDPVSVRKLAKASREWKCTKCSLHIDPDPLPEEKTEEPKEPEENEDHCHDHEHPEEEELHHDENDNQEQPNNENENNISQETPIEEEPVQENPSQNELAQEKPEDNVKNQDEINNQVSSPESLENTSQENIIPDSEANSNGNVQEKRTPFEILTTVITDIPSDIKAETETQIGASDLFNNNIVVKVVNEQNTNSDNAENSHVIRFNPLTDVAFVILIVFLVFSFIRL